MSVLDDFLNSDVQTMSDQDRYLGCAKNVQSGHHKELELTGNAFNVRFSPSGVCIENLWDEDSDQANVSLKYFIEILLSWIPK
jgi:hypothetical protein